MAKSRTLIGLVMLATLVLTACEDPRDAYVGFAQCLTNNGTKMYGAYWCPHCARQKELFGPKSFAEIKYIECDPRGAKADPKACIDNKIESYPTWIFGDGTRRNGEMSFEDLSISSKCPLPQQTQVGTSTQPSTSSETK